MTVFWIIRHGQTNWNLESRYQGIRDIPLNETGIEQARNAALKVKDINFEAVYCSPLDRAYKTAEAATAHNGLEINVEERLIEIAQGSWEGMLFSEIREKYPEQIENRKDNPLGAYPPDGETVVSVAKRIEAAAREISERHPVGPVLLVSHGLALATLKCMASRVPINQVYLNIPPNAEPEEIVWDNDQCELIIE